ncbi:RICIN domain-containing protein [Saccharothrix sp. 6-C]|uniref:pectinesterase family protein n=1 Tax=Saccharothrix sp. 6-C TaxID=2781735 RepID=UPI001AF24A0B|nr:pectinesterase family protein [Saccharothrix sp. 6-C]QQQ74063.1 RICIN domain-containing protein [Saccharothrix sp. 6-C]
MRFRSGKTGRASRFTAALLGASLGLATLTSPTAAAAVPAAGTTYQVSVKNSGMCLDVIGGAVENGALVQQWDCWNGAMQQWALRASGSGAYALVNVATGKCLDIPYGTAEMFVQAQQWSCSGGLMQQWRLVSSGSGTYQLVNVQSGLCLANKDAGKAAGVAVVQETCTANSNKQWLFTPVVSAAQPTVAADGTGRYRKVQDAVNAVPADSGRTVITIKPGTYREVVRVPSNKPNITFQGLGTSASQTVIVFNNSAGTSGTSGSASVFVDGRGFEATNLTIANDFDENSTSSGHQAVALHLNADRALFRNVRLLGDQDTFLVNDNTRAYVADSYVEGTVDFIFGGGTIVFDRTTVHEKRTTGGPITAASTPAAKKYGFLFYRCTVNGATSDTTQLGRPWRPDAQVLYRESTLNATVKKAEPWTNMSSNNWRNARFLEYRNTGSGSGVNGNRPQLSDAQAAEYTPQKYLAGTDGWNPIS